MIPTDGAELIFVSRFEPEKGQEPIYMTPGEEHPIGRWFSVYGTLEDSYRGAATFIRDALLGSTLAASADQEVIKGIKESIRQGDVESVIASWNEEVPTHKVKVYKGRAL